MEKKWTKDEVLKIVCNPIYTGMGPFPQIIDEEQWLVAACKTIRKDGALTFLQAMLCSLREAFDADEEARKR